MTHAVPAAPDATGGSRPANRTHHHLEPLMPTTPDRPADQLRAAAEKLRALLADLDDCRGPWYVVNREQRPYPQRIDNIGVPYVVASTTTDPNHPPTLADYICTMHPGVGLALAAWLEREAEIWQAIDDASAAQEETGVKVTVGLSTHAEALAVARQLLGTTSEDGRCPVMTPGGRCEKDADHRAGRWPDDPHVPAASPVSERIGDVQAELLAALATGLAPDTARQNLVARYRAAVTAAGGQPTTAGRAAVLNEAADECDRAGGIYASRAQNEHAGAAFALMETFRRKADEAEYIATPCSVGACEPGGEPCTTHERLMAHAEGDHELCDHKAGEAAAGVQPPTSEAHRPRRGDAVAQWLRAQREAAADYPEAYQVTDGLLDLYRLHADTGTPLDGHVCEGRVAGDCECLEAPAVPAAPEETQ
ncbi:hypothetical protein ABZ684_04650 [Streptomyces sp. NPDC006995]|uniref:hypothetical protein n=1 Tax=Streptomyces sp. NPDC006995 TaxID=3156907 RepID=UPI0033C22B84